MTDTVTVHSFPIVIEKEDAMQQARRKGGPLGRLFLRGQSVYELRLHFVEYFILTFEVVHTPNFISRTFFGERGQKTQYCRVLANGSTGGAAWAEELPDTIEEHMLPEANIQTSQFSLEHMTSRGKSLVLRVLRRRIGGMPQVTLKKTESVYRPFYVALYGQAIEGKKQRYIPIAADGWGTHRTF
ncbi:MAG: hypothetical protein CSA35_05595 [Dethiosulfovibrio peptidovorans]|nr:MAG: hypothetical protein CSA35_05595 [Dethiosulfovibrio peptidovorans]